MDGMFHGSDFNGDISGWDVSNVADMRCMFRETKGFNGDISYWDVSKVTDMAEMFHNSNFNGNLKRWDTKNVKDMSYVCKVHV